MRRRSALLVLPLAAVATLGVGTVASAGSATGNSTTYLAGFKEVPGPGDVDGRGVAGVQPGASTLCVQIRYFNIDAPTGAHIHEAPAGVAGDIVVDLSSLIATSPAGQIKGCVSVDPDLSADIAANPSDFYANVHNAAYPAGAIRGQLSAFSG